MISMVGIAYKNEANQQSCYKHPLRTKGKVHFELGFGGRPWVFCGEVEHSSPAFGDDESPSNCWGREGYGPIWRRFDRSWSPAFNRHLRRWRWGKSTQCANLVATCIVPQLWVNLGKRWLDSLLELNLQMGIEDIGLVLQKEKWKVR